MQILFFSENKTNISLLNEKWKLIGEVNMTGTNGRMCEMSSQTADTLIWTCPSLWRLCQCHSTDLFWRAYWPTSYGCRTAAECGPSVASDVDRQPTLCEWAPVGWCCSGLSGGQTGSNAWEDVMPRSHRCNRVRLAAPADGHLSSD